MRPLHVVVIALITMATLGILYRKNQSYPMVEEEQQEKAKKLFLGKRQEHSVLRAQDKVFPGCEELETTLNDLDFRRPAEEWLTTLELRELDQCEDPQLEEKLRIATESCFKKNAVHNECVTNLIFLRSYLRTRFEVDANDPENLADLLIREFGTKQPNFSKMSLLSEKLLDMDPSNVNFQRLWAVSKFISALERDRDNLPQGLQDEIYRRLGPQLLKDPEFQPYRFFLETNKDFVAGESFARNFINDYPQKSQAHEILGWALWQQGRKEEALESLQRAIKLSPKDEVLKKMYKDLKSPKADKGTYQGRLHLSMNLEELFD